MARVFINYSSRDAQAAAQLRTAIESAGHVATHDVDLPPDAAFDTWVRTELERADAVVTLWSPLAVDSRWVREEAFLASRMDKYFPAIIEDCELPTGFNLFQNADLRGWRGDPDHPGFVGLLRAIELRHGERRQPAPPRSRRPSSLGLQTPRYRGPSQSSVLSKDAEEIGAQVAYEQTRRYTRPGWSWRCPVFIAHASDDKPRLAPLVKILAEAGYPVWIDKPHLLALPKRLQRRLRGIDYGGDWKEQIRKAVRRSRVVLAFWSASSTSGDREQFQYEVYMGLKQGKLRQCRIDVVPMDQIGRPYVFDHIADLADFEPDAFHPVIDQMMASFLKKVT